MLEVHVVKMNLYCLPSTASSESTSAPNSFLAVRRNM